MRRKINLLAHLVKYGIIDLFAGIGGVSAGFQDTGHFDVIALVDIDRECMETYKANYPRATYLLRDMADIGGDEILAVADGREIDGVIGCPPCQGYSDAGKRDPANPLNRLVNDYFRVVNSTKPKFIVMENVPGILAQPSFREILKEVASIGYDLWYGVLNSALFGVPQTRQRAIVLGYRRDLGITPTPPEATHYGSRQIFDYSTKALVDLDGPRATKALGVCPSSARINTLGIGDVPWLRYCPCDYVNLKDLPPVVNCKDAIGDLPQPTARGEAEIINGHIAWGHTAELVARLSYVPEGGNLSDIGQKKRYFSQAYARLHSMGLGFTISTHFHNPGSGRFLHYNDTRSLTVREAARLQTLSDLGDLKDGFQFVKSLKASERMIGNAFPTAMARAIARRVYDSLGSK